ncbi:MAG: PP2C family protein-serine/threonine phosphatase [Streptosporangiaceae bacterium]
MTLPASTHVGRLYIESRHLPATQGGGGDIHDVMATPFGVRLLVGDVMGTGLPANRTGLTVLNAWRELACTEPSLADIAVRLQALITRSEHPERFVTALLVNFPVTGEEPGAGQAAGCWAELVCCGHPPPLLLRGGSAAFVGPYAAPPLGLLDLADGWCRASMIPVGHGDQLLLYTVASPRPGTRPAGSSRWPRSRPRRWARPGTPGRTCSTRSSAAWTITSVTVRPTTSSSCCW